MRSFNSFDSSHLAHCFLARTIKSKGYDYESVIDFYDNIRYILGDSCSRDDILLRPSPFGDRLEIALGTNILDEINLDFALKIINLIKIETDIKNLTVISDKDQIIASFLLPKSALPIDVGFYNNGRAIPKSSMEYNDYWLYGYNNRK